LVFNLSIEEYDRILNHQNGNCAICCRPPRKTRLAVDHDHKTGKIRGLLCWVCNKTLGMFRDDANRIENCLSYIRMPPATKVLGEERFGSKGKTSNKASTRKRLNKKVEPAILTEQPKEEETEDSK
jgi:hypothetical protein